MKSQLRKYNAAIMSVMCVYSAHLYAGDLTISPTLSTSLVSYETRISDSESIDANILSISSTIAAIFDGNRVSGDLSIRHNHLQQDINNPGLNDTKRSEDFTTIQYSVESQLVDNVFTVFANGGQSQRNLNASQSLVNDEYLGSESLSKTQNNTLGLEFIVPNPTYVGMTLKAESSNVKSGRQTNSETNLSARDENLQATLFQGESFSKLGWDINGQYRKTNGSSDNDLTSWSVNGVMNYELMEHIRFLLSGSKEQNERGNDSGASINNLSNNTYGIGLGWFTSADRYINITYNSASQTDGERSNFIGADLKWRLTRLTNIEATYGRRFFGKSGSFSLNHNNRKMRTSITYREDVTTFSRLVLNTGSTGVFVCPIGDTSLSSCFQPTDPTYQLQLGEQFTNLQFQVPDISEEVILSKSLNASVGFTRRKITMQLSLQYNDTSYLETLRRQTSKSANLSVSYAAGRQTNINFGLNNALTNSDTANSDTTTWSANLGLSRQLGRHLSSSFAYRYLNRESSQNVNDLVDNRVTLSMVYTF
jgi:uncharacterized protein (PEP-CTERM system associated)